MQEEKGAERGGHREASCNIIDNENENVRCRSCTKRQLLVRRGVPGQPWKASSLTSTGLARSVMSPNDSLPILSLLFLFGVMCMQSTF